MSLLEVADIIIQNKILVLLGQQNTETGLGFDLFYKNVSSIANTQGCMKMLLC